MSDCSVIFSMISKSCMKRILFSQCMEKGISVCKEHVVIGILFATSMRCFPSYIGNCSTQSGYATSIFSVLAPRTTHPIKWGVKKLWKFLWRTLHHCALTYLCHFFLTSEPMPVLQSCQFFQTLHCLVSLLFQTVSHCHSILSNLATQCLFSLLTSINHLFMLPTGKKIQMHVCT